VVGARWVTAAYQAWVQGNSYFLNLQSPIVTDEKILNELCREHAWYLIISNHQSWADILVLQAIFAKRLPHLTFVMKESLQWIPIIGLVCRLLKYPFVKRAAMSQRKGAAARHDQAVLAKTFQHLSCYPSTVVTFVEGTRWRLHKVHAPYRHVLSPKALGLAYALQAFREQSPLLLDVTIDYGTPDASMWDWLCGRYPKIMVDVKEVKPPKMDDSAQELRQYRRNLQSWLNALWAEKDAKLTK
jgi:1-acyl-sn-glycerol-3-phosphate acyltransferase